MAIEVSSVHEPRRLPRLKNKRAYLNAVRQGARRARERAGVLRFILVAAIVSTVAAIALAAYLYSSYSTIVDERLASGYLTSRAGIYAAPRVLRSGQKLSRERLVEALRRAGYIEAEASNVWSGEFAVRAESIEIRPRPTGSLPSPVHDIISIRFDNQDRIAEIRAGSSDAAPLTSYALEPETLTNDTAMKTGQRAALAFDDIPPVLMRAIISIEDRRFFEHHGLDLFGIGRALLSWGARTGSDGEHRQGGSTITQQLVKNTYLSPERTLRRKFNEAMIASVLERRLSKEDIFALYCNEIYLGQRAGVGVRGVAQAAQIFFGKELNDLSLAEAATIAGMVQSPGRYAPDRYPERARARRNVVIAAMLRDAVITSEQAGEASRAPVEVAPAATTDEATAPYFIDYVNRVVDSRLASSAPADERELRVYTTIDLELQLVAETAIKRQLEQLEKIYKGRKRPQAALVAMDPRTGHVLAMVGGNRYGESQLNRATDARRQPGSVFKPFVYAAALESGISPVSIYRDEPRAFQYDRRATYRPANYGGAYSMRDVTMRTGLIKSLNVVTVEIAQRTGLGRVAQVAESFGLPKPAPYPALALGTTEATPLEIATAYAALANGGRLVNPTVIARYAGAASSHEEYAPPARQVIQPTTAYMLTDMLAAVINQGTARAARGAVKHTAIAGKTGTSRDGWFAGYTPNLVCVVWIGFDDNSQLGLTGAESALPAWTEFIKGAVELRPELGGEVFERPAGLTTIEIDPETGLRATPSCPQRERIMITTAHASSYECYTHKETLLATADADIYEPMVTDASVSTSSPPPQTSAVSSVRPLPAPRSAAKASASNAPQSVSQGRTTRVEVGRSGRPVLTNELRASESTAGSDDWKH